MKRFAKDFEIDLTFFHAFRHYFAFRCLLSGFTVQHSALGPGAALYVASWCLHCREQGLDVGPGHVGFERVGRSEQQTAALADGIDQLSDG